METILENEVEIILFFRRRFIILVLGFSEVEKEEKMFFLRIFN